jgi:hypothetical protein
MARLGGLFCVCSGKNHACADSERACRFIFATFGLVVFQLQPDSDGYGFTPVYQELVTANS